MVSLKLSRFCSFFFWFFIGLDGTFIMVQYFILPRLVSSATDQLVSWKLVKKIALFLFVGILGLFYSFSYFSVLYNTNYTFGGHFWYNSFFLYLYGPFWKLLVHFWLSLYFLIYFGSFSFGNFRSFYFLSWCCLVPRYLCSVILFPSSFGS